jgi:hypothetical protein
MGILLVIGLCGALLAGAFGIYDLQTRLERWDRERHAED